MKENEGNGLNISSLEKGTKLNVETTNSIYRIEIVEGNQITIMGGMTKDGEIRFPTPVSAKFIGSTWGGSMIKLDWIGEYMKMEIFLDEFKLLMTTSFVQNVEIEGPFGEWNYSMDWNR